MMAKLLNVIFALFVGFCVLVIGALADLQKTPKPSPIRAGSDIDLQDLLGPMEQVSPLPTDKSVNHKRDVGAAPDATATLAPEVLAQGTFSGGPGPMSLPTYTRPTMPPVGLGTGVSVRAAAEPTPTSPVKAFPTSPEYPQSPPSVHPRAILDDEAAGDDAHASVRLGGWASALTSTLEPRAILDDEAARDDAHLSVRVGEWGGHTTSTTPKATP